MPLKRRCPCGCNQLVTGSRCATSRAAQRAKYAGTWRKDSADLIAAHVALYGWTCPGDNHHSPHPSTDLTTDHHIGVLCRAGNTARRNHGDG